MLSLPSSPPTSRRHPGFGSVRLAPARCPKQLDRARTGRLHLREAAVNLPVALTPPGISPGAALRSRSPLPLSAPRGLLRSEGGVESPGGPGQASIALSPLSRARRAGDSPPADPARAPLRASHWPAERIDRGHSNLPTARRESRTNHSQPAGPGRSPMAERGVRPDHRGRPRSSRDIRRGLPRRGTRSSSWTGATGITASGRSECGAVP